MKFLLLLFFSAIGCVIYAQSLPMRGGPGGLLSFGQRSTLSTFNGHEPEGNTLGVGGQFRIQLSNRVNTEWFLDYLPKAGEFTKRTDYHIGWSVLFYLREDRSKTIQPYVLAGHCFDKSNHTDLSNATNKMSRLSGAIQGGMGMHYNFTERFDVSLTGQYMIHLGTDVHTEITNGAVVFEKEKGGSLEGHLLWTLSLNYKVGDLWKR